jgi:hypothetical protein
MRMTKLGKTGKFPLGKVKDNDEGELQRAICADMQNSVVHIELTCPECNEHLSAPNGSHLFDLNEKLPDEIECDCCHTKLKIPARAKKLGKTG